MNKLNGRAGGRGLRASIVGVVCGIAGTAIAADPVLDLSTATMTTSFVTSASAGQGVLPQLLQRGVGIDGSRRAGSSQGWSISGNPFGEPWNISSSLDGVVVATGAPQVAEVDIALPSAGPQWVVGRSYNPVQTADTTASGTHIDSNGYQGRNWFQNSQPELFFHDTGTSGPSSGDVVYIIYGADRFIELEWVSTSLNDSNTRKDEFKAKNGAAGVIQCVKDKRASDPPNNVPNPDLWTYTDQLGHKIVFFGGNTASGAADWQFWKMSDEAGNTIYVGDKTVPALAVSNGYSGKRILKAYDQADRRYAYTYSTIDSVSRLTQVQAQTKSGGTWASPTGLSTVAQVDYAYYQTGDNTHGDNGCLKLVTTTTPLSDGATSLTSKAYYRYYKGSYHATTNPGSPYQIKLIVGAEGTRSFDWTDSTFDSDFLTASDSDLKPYSDAYYTYYDVLSGTTHERARVSSAFYNGQCGCSGGGGNGVFSFSYGVNGSFSGVSGYDDEWSRRAVVQEPTGRWVTQYVDEVGQPISRVITDGNPTGTVGVWATKVVRDTTSGVITEIHTPANSAATTAAGSSPNNYVHSSGSIGPSTGGGLVTVYGRVSSGDLAGLVQSTQWKIGSGTAYYSTYNDYDQLNEAIVTSGVTVVQPIIENMRSYTAQSTSASTGYVTQQAVTPTEVSAVPVGQLFVRSATAAQPSVAYTANGSGSASETSTYLNLDRTPAFTKSADLNISYRAYDTGTGQMTMSIQDADTTNTTDIPSTPTGYDTDTGAGAALHLKTLYSYDPQGRLLTATAPDGLVSQQYTTRLADQRLVMLSVPRVVTSGSTTYYGPVSYTVTNQAGRTEFQGLIAFSGSGGSTTTGISSWIDTTDSDPILAVSTGTLKRMSTNLHSADGNRVTESRSYFLIPGSGVGTEGTNYDAAHFGYDDAGRQVRTKQATGTITRAVFDTVGRQTESWIGTNDSSWSSPAGEPSGTDNMTKTSVTVYDGGAAGGNSLVTSRTVDPDGNWNNTGTGGNPPDDRRTTTYLYDGRNRLIVTTNPQAPHSVAEYDNLGRTIATGTYSSTSGFTGATTATGTSTGRLSLSETYYDDVSRVWKSVVHKVASNGTYSGGNDLTTYTWYDAMNRVVKTMGSSISKAKYDRVGRATNRYTIAATDDIAPAASGNHADALTITGDTVLEENNTYFQDSTGLPLMTVALARHHDDTTSVGALDQDGDLTQLDSSKIVGRAQISVMFYDAWRRPIDTVMYGTNGGTTYDRDNESSAPSRSATALVSTTTYDTDGTVLETTDPRGLKMRQVRDDLGRTIKDIRNYTDGTPGGGTNADQDQTIEYGYSKGLRTTYTAKMPGGTDQVTTYIYGTTKGTSAGLSAIATGHLLRATKFPDSSNSGTTVANIDSSDSDVVSSAYNSVGQEKRRKDQAGSVTEWTYDTGGRETARAITTLASGFDNAVLRIERTYTSKSQVEKITQHSHATNNAPTDEVKFVYDDWGNVTNFQQDKDGTIAGGGYREVAYTYDSAPHQATGAWQGVRLTTITLPGSREVDLDYGASNSIDDQVNRVNAVKDILSRSPASSTSLAAYQYMGVGQIVGTELFEPDAASLLHDAATPAAAYDGLDRFNRVKVSRWTRTGGGVNFYEVGLEYDEDSNIVSAEDNVLGGFDAAYTMDGLNRLIVADEGTLSGSSITSRTRKETWTLNQVGGWTGFTSDLNGDGTLSSPAFTPTSEKNETRTFNTVNEMSTRVNNGVTKNPAYNANGQQTDDGVNYTYEWDAFGRLRKVKNRSTSAVVVEYVYNGLNHQIGRHGDLDADGDVDNTDKWEWFIYDPRWRRVATYMVAGGSTIGGSADANPKERYYHHAAGMSGSGSYIDAVICRNRDQTNGNNGTADGTLEQRLYYAQNWRADVSVTMTDTGRILEWLKYSAYGVVTRVPLADFNRDGTVDLFDDLDFDDCFTGVSCPAGQTADVNYDGFAADHLDVADFGDAFAEQGTLARGVLSQNDGSASVNRLGYAGYFFEPSTQQYLVRNREFDSLVGVWDERDALEYIDGANLYQYTQSCPITLSDPSGLQQQQQGCFNCRASGTIATSSATLASMVGEPLPCTFPKPGHLMRHACDLWARCVLAGEWRRGRDDCAQRMIQAGVECCMLNGNDKSCRNKMLEAAQNCRSTWNPCFTSNPIGPGTSCDVYPPCYSYAGSNARCFCRCADDAPWSNFVRACLQCMYKNGAPPHQAHIDCYAEATKRYPTMPPHGLARCYAQCVAEQVRKCLF